MAGSADSVAPGLPAASVDFNALNDALLKNPEDGAGAVEAAVVDREKARASRKPDFRGRRVDIAAAKSEARKRVSAPKTAKTSPAKTDSAPAAKAGGADKE